MTHRTRRLSRICAACDGFASVAITLGGRDRNGHLRTITADCPACDDTGFVVLRTRIAREGARA
ncbi:hypothetical protein ACFYWS_33770 [Streptomyces sp. NPDC002795]|uniref:hypothetical protein n=1 Tax=Streptomyces sp. NPDC002795 TaxID=3364665 RepID=UPI0036A2AF2F